MGQGHDETMGFNKNITSSSAIVSNRCDTKRMFVKKIYITKRATENKLSESFKNVKEKSIHNYGKALLHQCLILDIK